MTQPLLERHGNGICALHLGRAVRVERQLGLVGLAELPRGRQPVRTAAVRFATRRQPHPTDAVRSDASAAEHELAVAVAVEIGDHDAARARVGDAEAAEVAPDRTGASVAEVQVEHAGRGGYDERRTEPGAAPAGGHLENRVRRRRRYERIAPRPLEAAPVEPERHRSTRPEERIIVKQPRTR